MKMNRKKKRDRMANLEKEQILNPEKLRRKKQKRIKRAVSIGLVSAAVICILFFAAFQVVRAIGKNNLRGKTEAIVPQLTSPDTPEGTVEAIAEEETEGHWQEGWIQYKDQIYAYNEDIMTFLFMGIDKTEDVAEVAEGTDGGQADALFLIVLNPHNKSVKVISINRNTMTDINLYDNTGAYMDTVSAQIAVQHGFGNGMEESCEYQVEAVRNLFYNLPIHGYCAVNMDAVIPLTDLIGGIELTALQDVKSVFPEELQNGVLIREGETVCLDGKSAYSYVRDRDINEAGSADRRLERQKQFLNLYVQKVKKKTAADMTFPIQLYQAVTARMITDISADELTYLVSVAKDYSFTAEDIYSLKGETKMGERFEEYYVDEEALYQMILDIFYEPVEG